LNLETIAIEGGIMATFIVTNTNDSGTDSLRQAILDANSTTGTDTITFNIPGAGVQTIVPATALPTITEAVVIDATTQPGYAGTPLIEIDGTNAAGLDDGVLQITAGNSNVRGLIINRAGFSNAAILISSNGGNVIEENYLGTDAAGTSSVEGNGSGIFILDSADNIIRNNLVSGNVNTSAVGIRISGTTATNNQIQGNLIGTDVNGTADLGNAGSGIVIDNASNNIIGGTTAETRNIISGNDFNGIEITGVDATNNQIIGNYIGTDITGTVAIRNTFNGITINNASNNIIGGTAAGSRNLISGNGSRGIYLTGSSNGTQIIGNYVGTNATGNAALGNNLQGIELESSDNLIQNNLVSGNISSGVLIGSSNAINNQVIGNLVGTNANGTAAIANGNVGVFIVQNATDNIIGGVTDAERNIISGNGSWGVGFQTNATNNQLLGNFIGVDINGTTALGNGSDGVSVFAAPNNIIGGTIAGSRNIISGNGDSGIEIVLASPNTFIAGNYIGTDVTGTVAIGNADNGITTDAFPINITIGGTTPESRNVISGNAGNGIYLDSRDNQVLGNYIGTQADGSSELGNTGNGIYISSLTGNNLIGGTESSAGNVIAFNGTDGVFITGSNNNGILGNTFFSNGQLGIDLNSPFINDAGTTANDVGDADIGNNNLQNFPVITAAFSDGENITITGTLNSTANTTFRVEFFANTALDPTTYGEGETFLGFANVTTDAAGNVSFTQNFPINIAAGQFITATATDPDNNTSEFSGGTAVIIPSLSIDDVTVDEGNTGTVNASFTVTLNAAINQTVTADYTTANDTAIAGEDYTATTGTLTFAAGETSKTIIVPINSNTLDELNRQFFVNLSNATIATIADNQGIGNITDDDPAPNISIENITITEGNAGTTNATFTVSLNVASGQIITVDYATADDSATAGEDYTTTIGTLTFAAGETTQTITVPVLGDTTDEADETFFINLTNPTNATITTNQGIATITDDDTTVSPPPPPAPPQPTQNQPIDQNCNCPPLTVPTPPVTPPNKPQPNPIPFTQTGDAGNDTIFGSNGNNGITGSGGDDFLLGRDGNDNLLGGDGNDTLQGGLGSNVAVGNQRDRDWIEGNAGKDDLFGNEGEDTIYGGTGDDRIWGGKDDDHLWGEDGNDILYGDWGNDIISGGKGNSAAVGDQLERDLIFGNAGNDYLNGNEGNDTICAGQDDDWAHGGKDDDLIWGDVGNDTLLGEMGNDTLIGGTRDPNAGDPQGKDWLFGGSGDDSLYGNQGDDSVSGGDGNDTVRGGQNNDLVAGDAGNDLVLGDKGNDTLCGGEGNDTLIGSNDSNILLPALSEQDNLCGGAGNDYLFGNEGNDTINGGDGNDSLYGGKNNDTLYGSAGNDWLWGDLGNDWMAGGSGTDVFVLVTGAGNNIIADFQDGIDRMKLEGGLTFSQLNFSAGGNNTLLKVGDDLLATIQGVAVSQISAGDFI
jgi:Ca2+-binding RTX toxin-like protein